MTLDGISYFFIPTPLPKLRPPRCLFLAGFDQLMLGYEKTCSLFLPGEHIRDIFTRSGMVRPAILVDGTVVGWWNLKNRRLKITLFSPADKPLISAYLVKTNGNWENESIDSVTRCHSSQR